jgi:translocation and assembly module TamB
VSTSTAHYAKPITLRPRRRWPWFVVGLVGFVWLLPIVASRSPLRNTLLGWAASDLDGSLVCGSADWGWFSGVRLADVELFGPEGELIARAPTIAGVTPLWRLLFDPSRTGTVRIESPELRLVATQNSTNVEELIAPLLNRPLSPRFRQWLVTIEIVDGRAALTDRVTRREWQIDDLDAIVELHQGDCRVKAQASGTFVGESGGRISGEFLLPQDTSSDERPNSQARCVVATQNVPLAPLEAILRRFDPRLQLAGNLTTDLTVTWMPDAIRPSVTIRGNTSVAQLALAGSSLGEDRLQLARMTLPCELAWDGRRLDIDELRFDCDLGKATLRGQAPLSDFDWPSIVRMVAQAKAEAVGEIDLVRLAAALPRTLRIRAGTQLTGGRVQFSLSNRTEGEQPITAGVFEISQLTAVDRGRTLAWQQPLRVSLQTRETPQGPRVDRLEVVSEFLQAEASGPWDKLNGTARYDLARLTAELRKFFDMAGVELSGQGKGVFNWQRLGDGHFNAYAEMDLANFSFTAPGVRPWTEAAAKVTCSASGEFDLLGARSEQRQARLKSVYSAMAKIVAGGDQLQLQLKKAVFNPSLSTPWPVTLTLHGDLAHWQSRLRTVVPLTGWEVAGAGQMTASGNVSAEVVEIASLRATAAPLRARSASLLIDEPQAEMTLVGQLDRLQGQLRVASASFVSTSAQMAAEDVSASWPVEAAAMHVSSLSGAVAVRADIGRVHGWLLPSPGERYGYAGNMTANIRFQQQAGATAGDAAFEITNLQVLETAPVGARIAAGSPQRWAIWSENRLGATLAAAYDRTSDTVRLTRCDLTSDAININATGQLSALGGARQIDVAGQMDYDLERLTLLLRPYLGANISLSGRGPHSFAIRGPLGAPSAVTAATPVRLASVSKELTGEASFGWNAASFYGLSAGAGALRGRLNNGVLKLDPLDIPMSEGRLTLSPEARLADDPPLLVLPKGPLVKNVRVTPEISAAALKFVHPFLAGATSVVGRFSVELEGAGVLIFDAKKSQTAGRLKIESVEVTPGPLITQVLPLLAIASPRQVPLSPDVDFWVQNERVYHRGAGVVIGKTRVSTSGSIGFDESLELIAEVPIPEAWLGRNAIGSALRNQTLKIPIAGTLSKPQIDRRELDRLRTQFIGQAAGNVLEGALDRIFQPPAKKQP